MNLFNIKRTSIAAVLLSGMLAIATNSNAQSFKSKNQNPYKNPYTFRGDAQTPAFRGWSLGLDYRGIAYRTAIGGHFGGQQENNFVTSQLVAYNPELFLMNRWGKRLLFSLGIHVGPMKKNDIVAVNDDVKAIFKYNTFEYGYSIGLGFALEPYDKYKEQKNAILLSAHGRVFSDVNTFFTVNDGPEQETPGLPQYNIPISFELAYERVLLNKLHGRAGLNYSTPGSFIEYDAQAGSKISFSFAILAQF